MTTSECFVYLQLPRTLEVVTAGRFRQSRLPTGEVLGEFVYGRTYRERLGAVPIDPFELPLVARPAVARTSDGTFGALRDASPDAWGRRVIERALRRSDLSEVDYLLASPDDRAGALSFGRSRTPPAPLRRFNRTIHLAELLAHADAIADGASSTDEDDRLLWQLVEPGTSMGGARPKNVIEDDDGLWLAKFPMRGDRWSYARVEAATLDLAALVGIETPEARVIAIGGRDVLLVKRFDRERLADGHDLRHRMVSALTVLRSEANSGARVEWSYPRLADELRRWVRHPDADRRQLFVRMTFNALISNTDDHPRNHALIAPGADWRLSPAYDLVPAPRLSRDERFLAMQIGAHGSLATRSNLLSQCERFALSKDEASHVIDEMKAVVAAHWERCVRARGGSTADCEAIAAAFDYPGLEYPSSHGPR